MLELEQYQIRGRTARAIAASAESGIVSGALATGAHLPTVRALAATLRTSPATVNAAYRILRQRGLVVADGRRGTRVAPRPALRTPPSADGWAGLGAAAGTRRAAGEKLRDLTIGLPDPALLPSLSDALARVDIERKLRMSGLEGGDPDLIALARASFAADGVREAGLAVVGGAFDGIERVLQAHLRPGDRVVIEDPAYPATRDLLRALGLIEVPVPVDARGLEPDLLGPALSKGVEAVLIVPRAQNPLGSALDEQRSAELRRVLADHPDLLVIEDDHAGPVSGAPFSTVIAPERSRWAIIRSTSKFLHPDLRLALIAGDETTVARVEGRQALGTRWVSHVLQALVAEMLGDPQLERTLARARDAYSERRRTLIAALAEHDVVAHGRSGLNVWVPVREEAPVVRALLDAGWFALAGERFRIVSPPGIRVTVATLNEGDADQIARTIAAAEHAARPRRLY